jgi:hypothetical protein
MIVCVCHDVCSTTPSITITTVTTVTSGTVASHSRQYRKQSASVYLLATVTAAAATGVAATAACSTVSSSTLNFNSCEGFCLN